MAMPAPKAQLVIKALKVLLDQMARLVKLVRKAPGAQSATLAQLEIWAP
jgi:hypothetical protein